MNLNVDDILAPGGLIADHLDTYEARPEQLEMAREVYQAFADREHLLAEAGTGVGKSFAYLVPAIIQAAKTGKRIVVSTYTIALQEQLIGKDLPFLHEVMPVEFSAVLAKGRRNYLCFRRMAMTMKGRDKIFASERHQDQLDRLADWAMGTETGELQDIDFPVDNAVWSRVCSEPGLCRGSKCPSHSRCHLQVARQRVQDANIVVTNHALFFADMAIKTEASSLLGDYEFVVLDEAHTIESTASDHFGMSVSSSNVNYLLRELYNDQTDRGLLALMGDKDAIKAVNKAASASDDFFEQLASYSGPNIAPNGRILAAEVVPDTITEPLKALSARLRKLRQAEENEDQKFELLGFEMRAMEMAQELEHLIFQPDEQHAYWLTKHLSRAQNSIYTLACAPINVAPILRDRLFYEAGSVVLTSATLATARGNQHGFEYIRKRLGMEEGREILLASPFDYRKQARLFAETQLGNPNNLQYFAPTAAKAIQYFVRKSEGRCFVLATSYSMLRALADELEEWCDFNDYNLFVQGGDLQRSAMLEEFRKNPRSILIGTLSFWQGVDVAGDALTNVIITKLPFAVPDEPITEARIDAIRKSGGNAFGEFQLPQAIILFKQGFGRLIRSRSDRGFVVVLDHRLATKRYGQDFLNALPDTTIIRDQFYVYSQAEKQASTPPEKPE